MRASAVPRQALPINKNPNPQPPQEAGTTRTGVAVGAATFDDTLASGAAVEVCELNLNHRITISVENDDFSCEEPALLFAARSGLLSFGANADKSMTLVNRTDGRELKINIERTLQDDGSQKVTVYAPFWIYNKTPFNLAYAETSLTSKTVAAGVPVGLLLPCQRPGDEPCPFFFSFVFFFFLLSRTPTQL